MLRIGECRQRSFLTGKSSDESEWIDPTTVRTGEISWTIPAVEIAQNWFRSGCSCLTVLTARGPATAQTLQKNVGVRGSSAAAAQPTFKSHIVVFVTLRLQLIFIQPTADPSGGRTALQLPGNARREHERLHIVVIRLRHERASNGAGWQQRTVFSRRRFHQRHHRDQRVPVERRRQPHKQQPRRPADDRARPAGQDEPRHRPPHRAAPEAYRAGPYRADADAGVGMQFRAPGGDEVPRSRAQRRLAQGRLWSPGAAVHRRRRPQAHHQTHQLDRDEVPAAGAEVLGVSGRLAAHRCAACAAQWAHAVAAQHAARAPAVELHDVHQQRGVVRAGRVGGKEHPLAYTPDGPPAIVSASQRHAAAATSPHAVATGGGTADGALHTSRHGVGDIRRQRLAVKRPQLLQHCPRVPRASDSGKTLKFL